MRYCTWSVLGSRDWPGTFHTYPDGIQQPSGDSRPVSGSSRTSSVGPRPAAGGARELWELPARTGARSSRAVPGDSRTQVGGSSRENSRGDLPGSSWADESRLLEQRSQTNSARQTHDQYTLRGRPRLPPTHVTQHYGPKRSRKLLGPNNAKINESMEQALWRQPP